MCPTISVNSVCEDPSQLREILRRTATDDHCVVCLELPCGDFLFRVSMNGTEAFLRVTATFREPDGTGSWWSSEVRRAEPARLPDVSLEVLSELQERFARLIG
jgi:hypothetical protein